MALWTKSLPTSVQENGFNLDSAITSKSSVNCFLVALKIFDCKVAALCSAQRSGSWKGLDDMRKTSSCAWPQTNCISFAILILMLCKVLMDRVAPVPLGIRRGRMRVSHVWVTPESHPQVAWQILLLLSTVFMPPPWPICPTHFRAVLFYMQSVFGFKTVLIGFWTSDLYQQFLKKESYISYNICIIWVVAMKY